MSNIKNIENIIRENSNNLHVSLDHSNLKLNLACRFN